MNTFIDWSRLTAITFKCVFMNSCNFYETTNKKYVTLETLIKSIPCADLWNCPVLNQQSRAICITNAVCLSGSVWIRTSITWNDCTHLWIRPNGLTLCWHSHMRTDQFTWLTQLFIREPWTIFVSHRFRSPRIVSVSGVKTCKTRNDCNAFSRWNTRTMHPPEIREAKLIFMLELHFNPMAALHAVHSFRVHVQSI